MSNDKQWSSHLIVTTAVACLASIQYGYHMSELNGPGAVLSCQISAPSPGRAFEDTLFSRLGRIECMSMSDQELGLATSIFSIGGLIGSLYAGSLAELIGRKKATAVNGVIFVIGSIIMTFANELLALAIGRFVAGLAAGCSIVVTPLFINEISPHGLKGFLGSMNQVAINLGILLTQVLAISWANNNDWRWILFVGAILGGINTVAVLFIDESPKWLASKGYLQDAQLAIQRLRGSTTIDIESDVPLLPPSSESANETTSIKHLNITIFKYISDPIFKNSIIVVTAVLAGQQFCGINSIIFYGVNTIRKLTPDYAVIINCFISLGNAVITFIAAPFVDKYGRIPCLVTSVSIMSLSSVLMSIGILKSIPTLSVLSTFTYVGSFAVGLGPIPFLLISEVTQPEARGAAQSYGTVINWISTFLVGFLFPILDAWIGGYVYLIFASVCIVFAAYINSSVPETKGHKTYEEVWNLRVD